MENAIFTPEFLKEIGFEQVDNGNNPAPQYGKAKDVRRRDDGRTSPTTLHWNNEGHSCTYNGEPLDTNVHLTISKDAETRRVFVGYVFTQDDVKKILSLTW